MNLIEIFYTDAPALSGCGTCASAPACESDCIDVPVTVESTISDFKEDYPDSAEIIGYRLDDENKKEMAQRLQEIYKKNGELLIITSSNISFILSRLTPIIAINEELTTTNYVPTAVELKLALDY